MHLNITKGRPSDFSPQMYNFLTYFQTAKQSICLIYSHVNPIILLVVLRPFRVVVKTLYIYLFKSHRNGFGFIDEKTAGKFSNHNGVGKKPLKKETRAILQKVVPIILIIKSAFVIFLVASFLTLSPTLSNLGSRQFDLEVFEEKVVYKQRVLKSMQFADLHLDVLYKYKQLCAEKHGQFQFFFMRCNFLTQHSGYKNRTMSFFVSVFFEGNLKD